MKTLKEIKEVHSDTLIKLKDGSIVEIYEESFQSYGCSTCDYGSDYGIDYTIEFEDGTKNYVTLSESYSSPVSQGDLMIFLLNNIEELENTTKKEFIDMFENPKLILGK